jgi:hypothetical protein
VGCNVRRLRSQGYDVMLAPMQGARPSSTLRHDPRSVGVAVMRFFKRQKQSAQ